MVRWKSQQLDSSMSWHWGADHQGHCSALGGSSSECPGEPQRLMVAGRSVTPWVVMLQKSCHGHYWWFLGNDYWLVQENGSQMDNQHSNPDNHQWLFTFMFWMRFVHKKVTQDYVSYVSWMGAGRCLLFANMEHNLLAPALEVRLPPRGRIRGDGRYHLGNETTAFCGALLWSALVGASIEGFDL